MTSTWWLLTSEGFAVVDIYLMEYKVAKIFFKILGILRMQSLGTLSCVIWLVASGVAAQKKAIHTTFVH
jgi:hypothetical protein